MPSWRLRSRMAVSKAPAATCSPAEVALLLPALLGRDPGGRGDKLRLAGAGKAVVWAHVGDVEVLHLPAAVLVVVVGVAGEPVDVLHAEAVVLCLLAVPAEVQVVLVAPAGSCGLHVGVLGGHRPSKGAVRKRAVSRGKGKKQANATGSGAAGDTEAAAQGAWNKEIQRQQHERKQG